MNTNNLNSSTAISAIADFYKTNFLAKSKNLFTILAIYATLDRLLQYCNETVPNLEKELEAYLISYEDYISKQDFTKFTAKAAAELIMGYNELQKIISNSKLGLNTNAILLATRIENIIEPYVGMALGEDYSEQVANFLSLLKDPDMLIGDLNFPMLLEKDKASTTASGTITLSPHIGDLLYYQKNLDNLWLLDTSN